MEASARRGLPAVAQFARSRAARSELTLGLTRSTHVRPRSFCASRLRRTGLSFGVQGQRRSFAAPLAAYKKLVETGQITSDERQVRVMEKLDALAVKLERYSPPPPGVRPAPAASTQSSSSSGGVFGFFKSAPPAKPAAASQKPAELKLHIPAGAERGLYIYGGCGTGKTFMMDLFLDNIPVEKKRRVHFHEWLIEVHERLHRLQKKNSLIPDDKKANATWTAESAKAQREALKKSGFDGTHGKTQTAGAAKADDLVAQVADEMLREAWLLCFDEFQVTHISDAIIMKRLFSILFEKGAVIIATSNRPPEDLYLNGLNRPLFTPFIPILRERNEVYNIDSPTDYRMATTAEDDDRSVWIVPNNDETSKLLERRFYRLCRNDVNGGTFLQTQGRRLPIPKCGAATNIAWFNFKDLCDKPLGAADYFAICTSFHTVFVDNIPKFTLQERDQVRRFITMIDSFYERNVKMVCNAGDDPIHLFHVSEIDKKEGSFDEVFAWDRTASRLIEMQSVEYLGAWAQNMESEQFLTQYDLTELSKDDIRDLWTRYDKDGSGAIDIEECRGLLEDVMEVTQGHRNVADELVVTLFSSMDDSGDQLVQFEEFEEHLTLFGLDATRRVFVKVANSTLAP